MRNLLLLAAFIFCIHLPLLDAQVKIGGSPTVNADAILELESPNKGLVFPRVALTDKLTAAPMAAHVQGMVVFNIANSGSHPNNVEEGYYFNNGSQWERLLDSKLNDHTFGDIKHGFQTTDHTGWYLLDGRSISSLSSNAQLAASSLGFSTFIPDATNRVLTSRGTLNSTGGQDSLTITLSNIPNYMLIGSSEMNGSHNHSIDPPNTNTTTTGNHTHDVQTAFNDNNSSTSQGYPHGNNHQAFRTTDRNQTVASSAASNILNRSAGNHNHSVNIPSFNSGTSGQHFHDINLNSGGSGAAANIVPAYLSTNTFIYLGL